MSRTPLRFLLQQLQYALAILLWPVTLGAVGASALLLALGYQVLGVHGGSMEPTVHSGSVVVVAPTPPEALQVGDVISYRAAPLANQVVTHRITAIARDARGSVFWTHGDANPVPDPWSVQAPSVLGRVVYTAPVLGHVLQGMREPVGVALLIVVPAGVLVVDALRHLLGRFSSARPRRGGGRAVPAMVPNRLVAGVVRSPTRPAHDSR